MLLSLFKFEESNDKSYLKSIPRIYTFLMFSNQNYCYFRHNYISFDLKFRLWRYLSSCFLNNNTFWVRDFLSNCLYLIFLPHSHDATIIHGVQYKWKCKIQNWLLVVWDREQFSVNIRALAYVGGFVIQLSAVFLRSKHYTWWVLFEVLLTRIRPLL